MKRSVRTDLMKPTQVRRPQFWREIFQNAAEAPGKQRRRSFCKRLATGEVAILTCDDGRTSIQYRGCAKSSLSFAQRSGLTFREQRPSPLRTLVLTHPVKIRPKAKTLTSQNEDHTKDRQSAEIDIFDRRLGRRVSECAALPQHL